MSVVSSAIRKLSPASPFFSLLFRMKKQIDNRDNANEIYSNAVVLLHDLLQRGYSFDSSEVQAAVEILRNLPARGACTRNFEKLYLKDEYTLRKLPRDPRLIPKGHWH